jgi:aspartyl protease family protein
MNRFLFVTAVAAISAVTFSQMHRPPEDTVAKAQAPGIDTQATTAATTPVSVSPPGEEAISAGPGGHFNASFKVNGRDVDGLVDTGATFVAINEQTARKIGISPSSLDYRYAVTTANGTTQAAHVTLDRMEVGSVRVRGVEAYVLKDKSLSGMLVGMSFMSKLKSYKVQDGVLTLKN